jgi:hypothetical protein
MADVAVEAPALSTNSSMMKRFAQSYYGLLGCSGISGVSGAHDTMREMYSAYLACPTAGDMATFIRESPQFAARHAELVVRVHGLVSSSPGNPLPEERVAEFVDRFRRDGSYTVDRLRDDLQACSAAVSEPLESRPPPDTSVAAAPPPDTALETTTTTLVDVLSTELAAPSTMQEDCDHEYLRAFEDEFQRAMFVPEYFAYKRQYRTCDELRTALPELHTRFNDVYLLARVAYLNYLNRGLPMHDFVKVHQDEFQREGFLEDLYRTMLSSDEYASAMCAKLRSLHVSMYDSEPHPGDVQYMLKRVRNKSMALVHEGLSAEVSDYRMETLRMGDLVDECYRKVLHRGAEEHELSLHIQAFRRELESSDHEHSAEVMEACSSVLRRSLIGCLEFHDVLKDIIRDELAAASRVMTTSQRYAALTAVLSRIRALDDYADVAVHVQDVITEFFSK